MLRSFLVFSLLMSSSLTAVCRGKVDVAPAYLRVDVVESGKTTRKLDLGGFRGQIDHFLWKALFFRGSALWVNGNAHMETYTAGLAVCLPYKQFYFTPSAGGSFTNFNSYVDFPAFGLSNLKEKFHSWGSYLGFDVQWCFHPKWRVGASIQYVWSKTTSQVKPIYKAKSTPEGPNYSFLLEHDLADSWSLNFGVGVSRSLTHEKHGLKGIGYKIGITYWY